MQGRDHREHALALHEELISTGKNNLSPAVALLLQLSQISVLAFQSSSCRRYGYLPSLTPHHWPAPCRFTFSSSEPRLTLPYPFVTSSCTSLSNQRQMLPNPQRNHFVLYISFYPPGRGFSSTLAAALLFLLLLLDAGTISVSTASKRTRRDVVDDYLS